MPEFDITVEFEVFCQECGAGLCQQSTGHPPGRSSSAFVEVQPCEKCLEQKFDEGYHQGVVSDLSVGIID